MGTVAAVRQAVRAIVEQAPELAGEPVLRRRLAENMVRVSLAAADLIAEEDRLSRGIAGRTLVPAMPLATSLAAGDINKQTAVQGAAGVLRGVKDAIDFPGYVTSLVTGVFQAMTTSNVQQLQAYADLLEAVTASSPDFAASQITPARAAAWLAAQFPAFAAQPNAGDGGGILTLKDDGDMPEPEKLTKALEATDEEVSSVDEGDLDGTLLPLAQRKLGRDRQAMLATMVLMGMNRVIIDDGSIEASMDLAVDARSTAEQTTAERFDTRVTTSGSGSFGMGIWGASASMSATVGYVKSDEQFSREDMRVKAGLRSKVMLGFHTEPFQLGRMANSTRREKIRTAAMVPDAETPDLLSGKVERNTSPAKFGDIPGMPKAPDPGSEESKKERAKKDFGPPDEKGKDDAAKKTAAKTAADKGAGGKSPTDKTAAEKKSKDGASAPTEKKEEKSPTSAPEKLK